jgi:hypothetical protein
VLRERFLSLAMPRTSQSVLMVNDFLIQLPVRERSDNELHVVLNWASEMPTVRALPGR